MGEAIYKMFRGRSTEAWHQLDAEEQDKLMEKVQATLGAAGGKSVVICNSQWASDKWMFFGVEEFPDMAALHKHTELLSELNWFRYIDSESLLGTEWPD